MAKLTSKPASFMSPMRRKDHVAYALPVDLAKSLQKDEIEVWLVALPSTALYLPLRISVPTAFESGSADMLSFQVNPYQP